MTTHMFAIQSWSELYENDELMGDSPGFLSRFLPSTFTLERSKIRLNI